MTQHSNAVFPDETRTTVTKRLRTLYGDEFAADEWCDRLADHAAEAGLPRKEQEPRSQAPVTLITYGDQFRDPSGERTPLQVLNHFLISHELPFSDVHLLPCFPYTSDDGFSVSDFDTIDPELGTWQDVAALNERFDVMLDLVLNHCSASHEWFTQCLEGTSPFDEFFIAVEPGTDVSQVTRPRSHPLLTEFKTADGPKSYWTTFSTDQLDLNYASPELLLEMMAVFLRYLGHGSRIVRLDAIAYLWKDLATDCIHQPHTHEVVKLMRDLADGLAPNARILTETNVPHRENVSYFGAGDEAHMVYQFSLAPLLLDALISEDATYLSRWLSNLETPPDGCSYFNFTASHDGVGVRPLEGLAPTERRDAIIARVRENGGDVSMKRNSDGSESPYELNITWYSALAVDDDELSLRRFLSSQMLMLTLQGVPAVYVQSLFAMPNWTDGVSQTGRARTINRRKFDLTELDGILADDQRRTALDLMKTHLAFRDEHAELFAADQSQRVSTSDDQSVLLVERGNELLFVMNVTGQPQPVPEFDDFVLDPYDAHWLLGPFDDDELAA